MSKKYCLVTETSSAPTTEENMRFFCQRPGRVDDMGKPLYTTEQSPKDICDINNIIRNYDKNGVILHVSKIEARYGDLSGLDFKEMQDKVAKAKSMFEELPSKIRGRFLNDPSELIKFMDNPDNREEAIKLGIINPDWTLDTDGMGEHVKDKENVLKKDVEKEIEPKKGNENGTDT